MKKTYYNPKHPAGYTGSVKQLESYVKNQRGVEKWLERQPAYTLHKAVQHRPSMTRAYRAEVVDQQWQADLVDMQGLRSYNDGYGYILTCIDIFTRYAWARPLLNKQQNTVVAGFKSIFQEDERIPFYLQTDQGKEFENKTVRTFLLQSGVNKQFSVKSAYKAALVERFHRTLRGRMWRYFTAQQTRRWIDVLPDLLDSYNNRSHTSLYGHTPSQMVADKGEIATRQHVRETRIDTDDRRRKRRHRPELKIGNSVRLSVAPSIFQHGYTPNWTAEIFKIILVDNNSSPTMYRVVDEQGEVIEGKFYREELQKVQI